MKDNQKYILLNQKRNGLKQPEDGESPDVLWENWKLLTTNRYQPGKYDNYT